MNYEAKEAHPVGTPRFKDETNLILQFQINTKINVVGNTHLEIITEKTLVDETGNAIWYEIESSSVATIKQQAQEFADAWVINNYPPTN